MHCPDVHPLACTATHLQLQISIRIHSVPWDLLGRVLVCLHNTRLAAAIPTGGIALAARSQLAACAAWKGPTTIAIAPKSAFGNHEFISQVTASHSCLVTMVELSAEATIAVSLTNPFIESVGGGYDFAQKTILTTFSATDRYTGRTAIDKRTESRPDTAA